MILKKFGGIKAVRFRKPGGASPLHIGSHLESQRREANRPLGFRPRGVGVSFGEIGVDGLRRDVITLRPIRSLAGAS